MEIPILLFITVILFRLHFAQRCAMLSRKIRDYMPGFFP